jgi:secondary thiamine-phosphate synthase enzyme
MTQQFLLTLRPRTKGFHLITDEILGTLHELPSLGLLHIFIQHTSAGLAISENADPTVRADLNRTFDELVPEDQPYYQHTVEGPDDMPAHVKSVITSSSVSIPIKDRKLQLGTWQGIYLCEFRREATPRKLILTVIS